MNAVVVRDFVVVAVLMHHRDGLQVELEKSRASGLIGSSGRPQCPQDNQCKVLCKVLGRENCHCRSFCYFLVVVVVFVVAVVVVVVVRLDITLITHLPSVRTSATSYKLTQASFTTRSELRHGQPHAPHRHR